MTWRSRHLGTVWPLSVSDNLPRVILLQRSSGVNRIHLCSLDAAISGSLSDSNTD